MSEPASEKTAKREPAKGSVEARARHQRRGVWMRRLLFGVLLAGAVVFVVIAFAPRPVAVDVAAVSRGSFVVTVDEDGRTRVKDRYVVSAPLSGNLARIELRPGDPVKPGTVVGRLLPLSPPLLDARSRAQAEARVGASSAARRQAGSTVQRVQTALELAQKEAERQRTLLGGGATSPAVFERAELEARTLREELASAQFGKRVADHEVELAKAALGRLGKGADDEEVEVISPVEGRVLRVIQESEGVVQAGTPLCEIGDGRALEIVVDVLTSDAVHIRGGAPVTIERWGGEQPLRAHVRLVEPSAFTRVSALGVEEQRVNVIIDLDDPPETWEALGDGYRVEARIETFEGDGIVSVPGSAVFRRGKEHAVIVVHDGHAQFRTVSVGRRNGTAAEITAGLKEGESVVLYPSDQIEEGTLVQPRQGS